jgi:hypothetical protein
MSEPALAMWWVAFGFFEERGLIQLNGKDLSL